MGHPQEIVDEDHERVFDRVCAIDVGKQAGMVCTRVPAASGSGRRVSKVWPVEATYNAVMTLADHLVSLGVQKVTVESTSDYWRIWFYLLEAAGLDVALVNARQVKNVPGRPKTDKLDAVWLAKLTEKGMLRPSLVPPAGFRVLRDYTRTRTDLIREKTRYWQRLEKLLEDALIKISSVASKLDTLSTRDMIEALIAGQRDPKILAGLARGKMRAKHAALVEALTGRFEAHHGVLSRILLDQIDSLDTKIDTLTTAIGEQIATLTHNPTSDNPTPTCAPDTAEHTPTAWQPPATALQRLTAIDGIDQRVAQVILAEIGVDMTRFPTAAHLVSWAKLSPRTIQSGTKTTTGKTGKGNGYLKAALAQAAASAARTNTFLGQRYHRILKRRGKLKALVAVARSILTIIWHLLADPTATYTDLGPDYHNTRVNKDRKIRSHIRQIQALGYTVTLTPAT